MSEDIKSLRSYYQQIEKLVDDAYNVFNEIGQEEWAVLKEPLDILIDTTTALLKAYRKKYKGNPECDNLDGMVAYLKELRNDIYNFRILAPQDTELQQIMHRIDALMSQGA